MLKKSSILDRFWNGFGTQIGTKSVQNRTQHRCPRWTPKQTLSDRLQMDFWSILASILGPRSAQDLPFWSQDRLQTPNFGAKIGPSPPTWSQAGPKTLSRHLRGPILEDLGPILMDLAFQFNDFLPHVGRFWTPVNDKEVYKLSK